MPVGWAGWLRGARRVNWLQDVFPEVAAELGMGVARGVPGRAATWLRNRSLRKATANVAIGTRMRDRMAAQGVEPRTIVVIPNWADGAAVTPVPRDANPLRAEWGLAGKFVVGYSGNMGRAHEFRTIVDAAAALREDRDIVFLFIGGGAQKEMIAAASAERGLANLLFKPYQPRERLAQSLGAADVHLVTLRPELEGLIVPSKFYGIAAAARPAICIGDPEGEIGSEIRAADCGRCVRQGDVAGLVAAIREMRDERRKRASAWAKARGASSTNATTSRSASGSGARCCARSARDGRYRTRRQSKFARSDAKGQSPFRSRQKTDRLRRQSDHAGSSGWRTACLGNRPPQHELPSGRDSWRSYGRASSTGAFGHQRTVERVPLGGPSMAPQPPGRFVQLHGFGPPV